MNYFIEGLQGSGKSTLVRRILEQRPEYRAVYEGDYSQTELAWCAYVSRRTYLEILEKYRDIRPLIEAKSHAEGDQMVICYTQIITDIPGFHKDLEQYEIYNNRVEYDTFQRIVLSRYASWKGGNTIMECSLFQNIVEDMILFRDVSDREILDFYGKLGRVLADKKFHICYLRTDDIPANIAAIREERSDGQGKELWFPLMSAYFDESPYAARRGLSGEKGLFEHLAHRQELELRICREIFPERYTVLPSKLYRIESVLGTDGAKGSEKG